MYDQCGSFLNSWDLSTQQALSTWADLLPDPDGDRKEH